MCLGCFYIYDIGSRTEAGYSAIFFKPESVGKIFPQPKANSQIDDGFNYSTTGKTPKKRNDQRGRSFDLWAESIEGAERIALMHVYARHS